MSLVKSLFVVTVAIISLGLVPLNIQAQYSGTLYSPYKDPNESRSRCLNFQTGLKNSSRESCDLQYGVLGINNDFDWLQLAMGQEVRTVIKDLGQHDWNDQFDVPAIAALPKLQLGEKRSIKIDVSGADGANGAPGVNASRVDPGSGVIQAKEIQLDSRNPPPVMWEPAPPRPKQDGKPKVDPAFVKAVVGHMYVVHVVDEVSDYYALFRVDTLENRTCTVSWKLIPPPQK